MKQWYIILLTCISSSSLFSQINPSDGCPTTAVLTVSALCTPNTYFMNGNFANGALVAPSCGGATNDRDDGWYRFVATATAITIEETSTDRDHLIQVWTGCGTGTNLGCDLAVEDATNQLQLTGLTIGTTYYIQLQRRSGNNASDMNGTICVYQTPQPDVAWPGTTMGTLACGSTTTVTGTTAGANVSCTTSSAGDHIYQFTTTSAADVTVTLCASSYDTQIRIYNLTAGNCNGTPVATNDDACGTRSQVTMTCLAAGTYVVIIEGSGTATGAYSMSVLVNDCGCTGPANDEPCSATPLTVGFSCVYTSDNNTGATATPGVPAPGCANYNGADLWYSFTVPVGGWVTVESSAGTMTDGGLALYSGTCAALTLIDCDDDGGPGNMPEIESQSLTPGTTVYVRHWEYGGNFFGTYNICAHEPNCTANNTNDFCEDAGQLTPTTGSTFASSTASIYTDDEPDNLENVFCGTIQNNSWYQFVATATSHSFPITTVVGCTQGIQAQVYEFSGGSNHCCHTFVSKSNCYNPGSTALGTVNATGLTVGRTYILMIDGYSGANCDFVIGGWSATNILPVEIVAFDARSQETYNEITWTTKSELNSKWFIVERSTDGVNFSEIGKLSAAGNSSQELNYLFKDENYLYPKLYYRLKEIDYDGTVQYSNAVMVMRTDLGISVYPNPTTGTLNISFFEPAETDYTIRYTDAMGRLVIETLKVSAGNSVYTSGVLEDLPPGIYFIEILDASGNVQVQQKIIRN